MENKIDKLLLDSSGRRTEIILDNQVEAKFAFDLHVRGFHVYKDVFLPLLEKRDWYVFMKRETKHTNFDCLVS